MAIIKSDQEEYPHPNESDWFLVKWLRLRKIGFFDEVGGGDPYSRRGWVSKKWGLFMWKFIIPVLVKLHKMKWQAVYDADENDEIGWEYKYLRDCGDGNGWVVRKISDIDPEDFTHFKAQYTKEAKYVVDNSEDADSSSHGMRRSHRRNAGAHVGWRRAII